MTQNDEDMLIWFQSKRMARNVRQGRRRNALGIVPTSYYVKQFLLCVAGVALGGVLAKWMVDLAVWFWLR